MGCLIFLIIFGLAAISLFATSFLSGLGKSEIYRKIMENIQLSQTITLHPELYPYLSNKRGYAFYRDKQALEEEFENYQKWLTMTEAERIEYYENKIREGKSIFIPDDRIFGHLRCKVLDKLENVGRTQMYLKVEILEGEHSGEVYWYAMALFLRA